MQTDRTHVKEGKGLQRLIIRLLHTKVHLNLSSHCCCCSLLYSALPLPQVLFMFAYTTLFGMYATWLFLETQHLAAPVAAHALCNFLRIPDFPGMQRSRHRHFLQLLTLAGVAAFGYQVKSLPLSKRY
jgi:prenyl protein peptidase